jgi:hypothetical protein
MNLGARSLPRMTPFLIQCGHSKTQTFDQELKPPIPIKIHIDLTMPIRLATLRVPTLPKPTLYNPRFYSTPTSTLKITRVPAPHAGNIRILSLNRPSARNAISKQLLSELRHQVEEISQEAEDGPTRALILASESDQAFCAGADLKERLTMSGDEYVVPLSSMAGSSY